MAIAYLRVGSIKRSKGQSAVAAAAYRSGQKLKDYLDGQIKDYSAKAPEVVFHEIFLPLQAPKEHQKAEKIWNDVQFAELKKSSNAQYAKHIEIALPREFTLDENIASLNTFISDFIHHGYGAQINIHAKPGNPHAHIMITPRPYATDGSFDMSPKQRKDFVYAMDKDNKKILSKNPDGSLILNKNGNPQYQRIPLVDKNGNQRFLYRPGKGKQALWRTRTVTINYIDDPKNIPYWKKTWQNIVNQKLLSKHLNEINFFLFDQFDRQGLKNNYQLLPQIHLGPIAHELLSKGFNTSITDTYHLILSHNNICINNLQITYQDWYNPLWCPNLSSFEKTYAKKNYIPLLKKRLKYLDSLSESDIATYDAGYCLTLISKIKIKFTKILTKAHTQQNIIDKIYKNKTTMSNCCKDFAFRGRLHKLQKYKLRYKVLCSKLSRIPSTDISDRDELTRNFFKATINKINEEINSCTQKQPQLIMQRLDFARKRVHAHYNIVMAKQTEGKNIINITKKALEAVTTLETNIKNKNITKISEIDIINLQLTYADPANYIPNFSFSKTNNSKNQSKQKQKKKSTEPYYSR